MSSDRPPPKGTDRPPPMGKGSDPPPPLDADDDDRDDRDARDEKHRARRIVQKIIGEGVRRAVEKGVEQITEGPENLRHFVQDMKLPREVANLLLQQMDDTKNGLYRATAKELRDFLDHTNMAEEIVKALTTLSFEIRTEIRFIPNDEKVDGKDKLPKPDVRTAVKIKDDKDDDE